MSDHWLVVIRLEIMKIVSQNCVENKISYNLCTPFKHDIRCASLCGVEFVVTKERREKRAQRESCLKGVNSLIFLIYSKRLPPEKISYSHTSKKKIIIILISIEF